MSLCEDLSKPWDRCDRCPSAQLERVPGADHLLCRHDQVRAAFGRERIAAAVARADFCRGTLHPRFR